jgi:hypothetical protein
VVFGLCGLAKAYSHSNEILKELNTDIDGLNSVLRSSSPAAEPELGDWNQPSTYTLIDDPGGLEGELESQSQAMVVLRVAPARLDFGPIA